jgi:pimeloyl-ACP methyl ester carboxylesterase
MGRSGMAIRMKKALAFLLGLLVAATVFVAAVYIPSKVIHAERVPITRTPAEVGLEFEDVVLEPADQSIRLAAWWMPAASPRALLVFVHGGASNRHSSYFRALAFYREMVSRHVSILALDLRNHGASDSDGRGLRFGWSEKEDLKAGIVWAKERFPELPLFAMGISMGGAVAIYAAGEDDRLDGIILVDPLLDTASAFENSVHVESGIPTWLLGLSSWSAIDLFGLPGPDDGPLARARSLSLPTLLIQDTEDPVTLATYARTLAKENPDVELWLAPPVESGHPALEWKQGWGPHVGAYELHPEETVGRIMAFLRATPPR